MNTLHAWIANASCWVKEARLKLWVHLYDILKRKTTEKETIQEFVGLTTKHKEFFWYDGNFLIYYSDYPTVLIS